MKTVALHNLGCKVNSYEVDIMQQNLQKQGYEIVDFEQKADYFVINTCSVTNIADRKSRQMIHRAKTLNPKAVVVAVGCYVQADAFHIAQDESVDLLIGNNRKTQIVEILEEYEKHLNYSGEYQSDWNRFTAPGIESEKNPETEQDQILKYLQKTLGNTTIADVRKEEYEDAVMNHTAEHTRAYIKIQDGCNRFCSYCIIPYVRGRVRSRQKDDILNEIMTLTENGFKEFVLTGIHISSYGLDMEKADPQFYLLDLLKSINQISDVKRIRIGSFEPLIIDEKFVEGLMECEKLCPHFHLSLQSGCDETLKRMNRRYTTGEYSQRVDILRKAFPKAAITTDVIVGFPGETEEEFIETSEYLRKINFYEMHIFKYSPRKGTVAAGMKEQIPEPKKQERSVKLLELEHGQSEEFRRKFLGETVEVLFEEKKIIGQKEYWIGHTREYVKIACETEDELGNEIMHVVPTEFLNSEILLVK